MTQDTPSPILTADDWAARDAALHALRERIQPLNKQAVFDHLREAGVTDVVITFDGCGDSGQIEEVTARAGEVDVPLPSDELDLLVPKWGQPDPERRQVSVREALETQAYDYLEHVHDGWEINDGAFGTFVFDVAKGEITLEYNERFMETEVSEHVF